MPIYSAILGHQPSISLAELMVLLPDMKVRKQWNKYIVTFETASELDQKWLNMVGGTVLIARELSETADCNIETFEMHIPRLLFHELTKTQGKKRKVVFSLRCLGIPKNVIRSLYRLSKQQLKAKGIPSRYIGNESQPAKPGTLLLRGIPGPGTAELVILNDHTVPPRDRNSSHLWIGVTEAVQDITAYTERDMGKPFRDTKTGLLPPKLAQIMLNLSLLTLQVSEPPHLHPSKSETVKQKSVAHNPFDGLTVWDPFCGSGVLALEAIHRGMHVLASDKSLRAVNGCLKNILWIRNREKTPKAVTHHVWKQDALKPVSPPRPPDVIVTETSLGPASLQPLTKGEISSLLREAEKLEYAFFENLATLLPGMPVVCTFPVFVARDGTQSFLPEALLTRIQNLGFRITTLHSPLIKLTERHSLLYLRPDQFVGREIICFLPGKKESSRRTNADPSPRKKVMRAQENAKVSRRGRESKKKFAMRKIRQKQRRR